MNRIRPCLGRPRALATLVTVLSLAATSATAQDVKATLEMAGPDSPPMTMDLWMGDEAVRMDMAAPERMSIVFTAGPSPTMLMIQHSERSFMEWGEQQFQMMRQMMQRMPGAGAGGGAPEVNPDAVRLEPTGRTETIGAWTATGVRMTVQGDPNQAILWIAEGLDVGLFQLLARMGDALQALQMPMMGGGGQAQSALSRYTKMTGLAGLPEGGVVRVESTGADRGTITLQSVEAGPFAENPFRAPDGYERMQMPMMPE